MKAGVKGETGGRMALGSRTAMAVMLRELEPGGEAHVERGRGRRGVRLKESGPFKTSRYADLLRMPLAGRGMVAVGCK